MLTCKEFLRELSEYLDGNCCDEIRRKVEAHVTECPNCFVVYDTTKRTIQVYKGMEPQPLPAEVHDRLMAALQKKMAARR